MSAVYAAGCPGLRTRAATLALCSAIALLAACDGEENVGVPPNGGGAGGGGAASGGSTGTGGDEADDCTGALLLPPLENTLGGSYHEHHGALDPAGDRDSFRFTAQAGQWFIMATMANVDDDPDKINTVLTLRDETGSIQLARSDDASPPARRDSEIIHRFAAGGSYCVQVSEHADLLGSAPRGGPSFGYQLIVHPVDFELYDDWNLDTEPNGELADTQQLSVVSFGGYPFARLAGQLGSADDVDLFRFAAGPLNGRVGVVFTPRANRNPAHHRPLVRRPDEAAHHARRDHDPRDYIDALSSRHGHPVRPGHRERVLGLPDGDARAVSGAWAVEPCLHPWPSSQRPGSSRMSST